MIKATFVHLDGTGPHNARSERKCKCGNECEFPCWQRVGIGPACETCGCPPFPDSKRVADVGEPRMTAELRIDPAEYDELERAVGELHLSPGRSSVRVADLLHDLRVVREQAERLERDLEDVQRVYPRVRDFLHARALSAASTQEDE